MPERRDSPMLCADDVIRIGGHIFEHKREELLLWPRFVGRMVLTKIFATAYALLSVNAREADVGLEFSQANGRNGR